MLLTWERLCVPGVSASSDAFLQSTKSTVALNAISALDLFSDGHHLLAESGLLLIQTMPVTSSPKWLVSIATVAPPFGALVDFTATVRLAGPVAR